MLLLDSLSERQTPQNTHKQRQLLHQTCLQHYQLSLFSGQRSCFPRAMCTTVIHADWTPDNCPFPPQHPGSTPQLHFNCYKHSDQATLSCTPISAWLAPMCHPHYSAHCCRCAGAGALRLGVGACCPSLTPSPHYSAVNAARWHMPPVPARLEYMPAWRDCICSRLLHTKTRLCRKPWRPSLYSFKPAHSIHSNKLQAVDPL